MRRLFTCGEVSSVSVPQLYMCGLSATVAATTREQILSFPGALHLSKRYQRNPSDKLHTPAWKEKVEKSEKFTKLEKEQREAEEALRRIQQRASRKKQKEGNGRKRNSAEGADAEDSSSLFTSVENAPRFTFFSYFRNVKKVPINPLHNVEAVVSKWGPRSSVDEAKFDPEKRSTLRLLTALNQINSKNRKSGRTNNNYAITEEQQNEIVNQYAATRWWGKFYYPFRNITESHLKISHWVLLFIMTCSVVALVILCLGLYFWEMNQINQLDPEDQKDYLHLVKVMRYSDIYNLMGEVIKKEDPNQVLPPHVILRYTLEEARRRNWMNIDWEIENRRLHPRSALEEFDLYHIFYWLMLTTGSVVSRGDTGVAISNYLFDTGETSTSAREAKLSSTFVEEGPQEKPAKRSFFS